MAKISLYGLDKAAVLAALYNAAYTGRGNPAPITTAKAAELLEVTLDFEFIGSRHVRINLETDGLDPSYFDDAHGKGRAEKVIAKLRKK